MTVHANRRDFLKGAVLVVGAAATGRIALAEAGTAEATALNPFVRIDADGAVTVLIKHFEMGQGTTTGLATLVAEEMDLDWDSVRTDYAPADVSKYANMAFGIQGTGGSTAIANSFMQYRQAGATARAALVQAAAAKWGVDAADVSVENGVLKHGDHTLSFADVATDAANVDVADAPMKDAADFRLIGNEDLRRLDRFDKTDGTGAFAIDMRLPGKVYCVIARAPKFGGALVSFDDTTARAVEGVLDVKQTPRGVAVYATNTWNAIKGRDALLIEWDFSGAETRSSDAMLADYRAALEEPGLAARPDSDSAASNAVIDGSAQVVEAEFIVPFLAHAPMEPLNCVIARDDDGGVTFYDGCQMPTMVQGMAAQALGLPMEKVRVKTVYAGGSFGRRATPVVDYQFEAATAFAAYGGQTPVHLVWTREDDLAGGFYRSMFAHKVRAGLDADGRVTGWDHRVAGKSLAIGTPFEGFMVHGGVDHSSVEGAADTPYSIPEMYVGLHNMDSAVPTLWWRSVGHSHTAFVMESMVDMLAEAADMDPIKFRFELLNMDSEDHKRLRDVLSAVADLSGWAGRESFTDRGSSRHGRGVAVHKSFNSYVAQVVDVSVDEDDYVSIDKAFIAVDCGVAVNPDVVKAQMEGGFGYALGSVMRNQITFTDGEVDQANFPDYEPLRISDMPAVQVAIVNSGAAPSGVGEPAVPPAAPALANAIFAATGKRMTMAPFSEHGVDFA